MKILVVGCSFAKGDGLDSEEFDPKLWVNQLVSNTFVDAEITNLSETGQDNRWILTESLCALTSGQVYDVVVVAWTVLWRFATNIGLETYSTRTTYSNPEDVNINPGVTVTRRWLLETGDRLLRYYNHHWSLLEIVKYVNILVNTCKMMKTPRIVFVNSLMNIPNNYFVKKDYHSPAELSDFEQQMLNVDSRGDDEIRQLYNKIHESYSKYGGIHEDLWLNLYQPLNDIKVDTVSPDDLHPGYKSQDLYAEMFLPVFSKILNNQSS